MDLSQIDIGNALPLIVGCVCLCSVGILLMTGLQVIGGFLGVFSSLFEILFDVLSGGPVAWCGCLVLVFGCGGGAVLVLLLAQGLSSCGTPQAINFCSIIGQ